MPSYRNIGGVWKPGLIWRNIAGVWKAGVVWRNVSGVWKVVGGQITATANPNNVSGSANVGPDTYVNSNNTTINVQNGSGNYTYAWSYVSGSNTIECASPFAQTTSFRAKLPTMQTYTATWQCVVTDTVYNLTAVATVSVSITRLDVNP